MLKVTISIQHEDGDFSEVTRRATPAGGDAVWLLAECIASIADTRRSPRLDALAEAAYQIARADR